MEGNLDNSAGIPNGVLINGTAGTTSYVTGRIGQAFHLHNEHVLTGGDYVSLNYTMPNSGTVALWYKPDELYNYNSIFDNSSNQNDWEMWIYSDGRLYFRVETGAEVVTSLNALAADGNCVGDWWHIVVTWTRNGSTVSMQMYINGELVNEASGPWVNPGSVFYLGGGNNGNIYGNGSIDDVRIYNTALTESEIKTLALRELVTSENSFTLIEGQIGAYQINLGYMAEDEPVADVEVVIIPSTPDVLLNDRPAGESFTLLFRAGNYDVPQTVQVTAIDNMLFDGNRNLVLLHQVNSNDAYWDDMSDLAIPVTIQDNDCGNWGYSEMDFNKDCYVNLTDFAIFCDRWLVCSNPADPYCIRFNQVAVLAHRGYSAAAPENTLSAFNAARGYADEVELDARPSADGVLVVMHDATVDRTTNGTGNVNDLTLAQLKELDAGSWFSSDFTDEKIPTLQEAVNAILPDMTPLIERKSGDAQQYVDLLNSMGVKDKVIIISLDEAFLNQVHTLAPEIKLGLIGSTSITDTLLVRLAVSGIGIVNWDYGSITDSDIQKIHAIGLKAGVWTVNDVSYIQAQIDRGVDCITTNYPAITKQLVEQY